MAAKGETTRSVAVLAEATHLALARAIYILKTQFKIPRIIAYVPRGADGQLYAVLIER